MPSDWLTLNSLSLYTGAWSRSGWIEAIPRISPRAVFLLSTGSDWEMHTLGREYSVAGEPRFEWNIPEAGHSQGLLIRPIEYEQKMVGFFKEFLLRHE
jgi:hypothetical protein